MTGGSGFLKPPRFVVAILRTLPLKVRGGLFLLCGLILVVLVFGGFSVYSVSRSADRAREATEDSLRIAAQRLDDHLAMYRLGVERVAKWPGIAEALDLIQSGRSDVSPPWIAVHFLASDPHEFGDVVFVTDRHGVVQWTRPPGRGILNRTMGAYGGLRRVLDGGETHVSDLHMDEFWIEPHVLVATAIRNPAGAVVGTVGSIIGSGTLKSGELFGELSRAAEEAGASVAYVVARDGTIVVATNPRMVLTTADAGLLSDRAARGTAAFHVVRGGTIAAVQPLAQEGWSVVFEMPEERIFGETRRLAWRLFGAAVLLAVFALVVWIPFVESFVDPIRALGEEAERIAAGDLSRPIPVEGRDEASALADSLERMRQQVELDRKKLSEQVLQLSQADRVKNQFVTAVSHELRTPLHIMRGHLDLILEGRHGEVPEHLQKPLAAASRQYQAVRDLIESCLTLVCLEAGQEVPVPAKTDLCTLIRELGDDFAPQFAAKELKFECVLPSASCEVLTDSGRVRRILSSLISNALKFTARGEVAVTLDDSDPARVVVRVRDTGPGISDDDRGIIFEHFRKGNGDAAHRVAGVGLGLSIAQGLARLLGGQIDLESAPGRGSTFSLTLPKRLGSR